MPRPARCNCPLASTVSAARIAIAMLAGGRRTPQRGTLPADRGDRAPRLDVPPACRPSPCFLYGWPGDQAMEAIYHARRPGAPDGRPGLQRRRHLLAGLVGHAGGHRRAVGGRLAPSDRPGRPRPRRRRQQPDPPSRPRRRFSPVEVWEAEQSVAAREGRARRGFRRPRPPPRRPGRRLRLPDARGLLRDLDVERKKTPLGSRGRASRAPQRSTSRHPTAAASRMARRRVSQCPRARPSSCTTAAAVATGPPGERDPDAVRDDVREGYITEAQARRIYPHAFDG